MHRTIACPFCRRGLRLEEQLASQEVRCPACAGTFVPDAPPEILDALPVDDGPGRGLRPTRRDTARPGPRPRRRPLPREEASPSSWRKVLAIAGVVGLLLVACLAAGLWEAWRSGNAGPPQASQPEDPEELQQDVRQAFRERGPLADAELIGELLPLFAELCAAVEARDGQRGIALFDVERMFDEAGMDRVLPARMGNRSNFVRGMRQGMANNLRRPDSWAPWVHCEIKSIKQLPGGERLVITRHRGKEGVISKMRWWLTWRGAWKIYDHEDLDMGLRASFTIGLLAQRATGGGTLDPASAARLQRLGQTLDTVYEALHALDQKDPDTAQRKLKTLPAVQLPPQLQAVRLMAEGILHLQRDRPKEALEAYQRAYQLHPDMPVLDFLRGVAHNELGEWAQGLKLLEAYRNLLGEDPQVCVALGNSLRGLKRFKEAATAYRKALDEAPRDANAFRGLLLALWPGDPRQDVPGRFARLDRRRENFLVCADDCVGEEDHPGLEQLAETMRKLDPDFTAVEYYLAVVRAWQGKGELATAHFSKALAAEKDARKRQEKEAGFLKAMAIGGQAVAAYRVLTDRREAFRVLAFRLHEKRQTAELKRLIQAHAGKHPDDGLLPLYQGELYAGEGNYPLAEKAFAAGLARKPEQGTLEPFRASRVLARCWTAGALSAYRDIGPREATFAQLAALLLGDRDDDQLAALLTEHARHQPDSEELLRYRCRLAIRQGKTGEGVRLFQTLLARQKQPEPRKQVVSAFLSDMVEARQALAAYRAAPEPRQAFEELASELLDEGLYGELRRLVEAHRTRVPDDPLLAFHAGHVFIEEGKWEEAARVLDQGWKRAGEDLRKRFRWMFVRALYKAGQGARAYDEVAPRNDTFAQLVYLLIEDGKGAELKRLVARHRKRAGEDAGLLFHEARAELLLKQPGRALALFQRACTRVGKDPRQAYHVSQLVTALVEAGQALPAYRTAPDRTAAFAAAAPLLLRRKKTAELLRLIEEHGIDHAGDPARLLHLGELYLLRGDVAQADQHFTAALRKVHAGQDWRYRNGLYRARVRAGKTVLTYREMGQGVFTDLAHVCLSAGSSAELEALLAAHRRVEPDDVNLSGWEVEARWLKKDYEGACKLLTRQRALLLTAPRWRWKFGGYLVRGRSRPSRR